MSDKIFQELDHDGYDVIAEIKNLSEFLKQNNFSVSDDFLNQIQAGDIVEVYSFPQNIQIYSNSEFKKLCSYSEKQMKELTFPKLFWRDQQVHMDLMKRAAEVCQLHKNCYKWDMANHELVESLHPRKRTFEIKTKNIAPCFKDNEKLASAFASTLQVEFIFEWSTDIS